MVHFPAHNPSAYTLCGTNCYLVGTGSQRILIEAGEADNKELLTNLHEYLETLSITISHVLITHSHHDHVAGLPSLLKSLPNKPEMYMRDSHLKQLEDG